MCKKNLSKISLAKKSLAYFSPEKKLPWAQGCVVVLVESVLCWKWVRGHFNEASILKIRLSVNQFRTVRRRSTDSKWKHYLIKLKWLLLILVLAFFPAMIRSVTQLVSRVVAASLRLAKGQKWFALFPVAARQVTTYTVWTRRCISKLVKAALPTSTLTYAVPEFIFWVRWRGKNFRMVGSEEESLEMAGIKPRASGSRVEFDYHWTNDRAKSLPIHVLMTHLSGKVNFNIEIQNTWREDGEKEKEGDR